MEMYNISNNSVQDFVTLDMVILGHFIDLLGVYDQKQSTFLVLYDKEIGKRLEPFRRFENLSSSNKSLINDHFKLDAGLKEQLNKRVEKHPNWEDRLKEMISSISIKRLALHWDRKKSSTVLYLELIIRLDRILKSSKDDFRLEFISLDLILKPGKAAINAEDHERKKVFSRLLKQFDDRIISNNQLKQLTIDSKSKRTIKKSSVDIYKNSLNNKNVVTKQWTDSSFKKKKISDLILSGEKTIQQLTRQHKIKSSDLESLTKRRIVLNNHYSNSKNILKNDRTEFELMNSKLHDLSDQIKKLKLEKMDDYLN